MILVDRRTGRSYLLQKEITIGRSPDCDIPIPDDQASRRHARLYPQDGRWYVQDLASMNGTFVNGARIAAPVEVSAGSTVQVGNSTFIIQAGDDLATGAGFTDEAWLTTTSIASATIDPAQCDLAGEAARVTDPEESAQLRARFEALSAVNRVLRGLIRTEEVEEVAAGALLNVFPAAKRCLIVDGEPGKKNMAVRAARIRPNFDSSRIATSRTIIEHVLSNGVAAMSANPQLEQPYAAAASVTRYNIKAFMCAPLPVRGRLHKVIYLDVLDEENRFTKDDLALLALIAQQVALHLDRASLLDELGSDKRALEEQNVLLRRREAGESDFSRIVGSSRAMKDTVDRARLAASTRSTVLLTGQTGTGKELLARAIHYNSDRADKAFIAVNCAAIAQHLIVSELFGHLKGAFTGADKERKGQFESADGGTILLDEIADMSLEAQAQVLRVLESGEVKRVGSSENITVDVRVIASTNKNLEEEIKAGRFRSDLFYRLNVFPIHIPPLCERTEDILPLLNYYLRFYSDQMHRKVAGFSREALAVLGAYAWPGNVRELKNAVERILIEIGDKDVIGEQDLPVQLRRSNVDAEKYKRTGKLPDAVSALEKDMILNALTQSDNNKTEAAKRLGLSRAGLLKMMKRLGIA